MSHENLLDPLVQQKLGNRVQFWNGLLVYSYGKELVQSFGSFSLKRLAEIKEVPGLARVETNPKVSAVSLRFRGCSSQDGVIDGCRNFNGQAMEILKEEGDTWQLANALLLGAGVRGLCDHPTAFDIWEQIVLGEPVTKTE